MHVLDKGKLAPLLWVASGTEYADLPLNINIEKIVVLKTHKSESVMWVRISKKEKEKGKKKAT